MRAPVGRQKTDPETGHGAATGDIGNIGDKAPERGVRVEDEDDDESEDDWKGHTHTVPPLEGKAEIRTGSDTEGTTKANEGNEGLTDRQWIFGAHYYSLLLIDARPPPMWHNYW